MCIFFYSVQGLGVSRLRHFYIKYMGSILSVSLARAADMHTHKQANKERESPITVPDRLVPDREKMPQAGHSQTLYRVKKIHIKKSLAQKVTQDKLG